VRAFAAQARCELGLGDEAAQAALTTTALLLSLIDPVLARWRRQPTAAHATLLEESFMTIVSGSLAALASAPPGVPQ
jgi:hypothetical protein